MDLKSTLRAITLELRRELEGKYDAQGTWQPGDLERRLASIGVRRDRPPVPVDELTLPAGDREARRIVDAFLQSRAEAGEGREAAIADFVREAAYSWANRLLALRCMEARGLIAEVILQKDTYGGRSLQHQRLARKEPERCSGDDEGLFAVLFDEFERRAVELPLLFDPRAPEVALRPSVQVIKRCVALLSGREAPKGQPPASDEVFTAPDAAGWAYQYWNTEEKDRVFESVRPPKRAKIAGADIIPATCIYTEPYMVKFLVQNSLGALWMGMHPASSLRQAWDYYVRGADRAPVSRKPVREIAFLDPACGSGHFLIEAFDLFFEMYREEGELTDPAAICGAIIEHNLFGIDIDERAVQIAAFALVMRAKEKAPEFVPHRVNLVATNIRLPATKESLDAFLRKHPEDVQLRPALLAIFEGLAHADELGSLLQLEEPVEKELRALKKKYEAAGSPKEQQSLWAEFQKPVQGKLPIGVASYEAWKGSALVRIREHFDADARSTDLGAAFFGEAGAKGVSLFDLLSRRYDVVAANPPYMGSKNMGPVLKKHIERHFAPGKRDLYAAFILRSLQLCSTNGRASFVAPQPWMFLRSFASLRSVEQEGSRGEGRPRGGLLRSATIETIAQLGRQAFQDADPPSNVALCVLAASQPADTHRLRCYRLAAPMAASEQASLLRVAIAGRAPSITFSPVQTRFLSIPRTPLCYWLRDRFFQLLAEPTLGTVFAVCQGLVTGEDERAVRFVWETPAASKGWVPHTKGGGYGRWKGNDRYVVDWRNAGRRVELGKNPRFQNVAWYFKAGGLWYSRVARKAIGARELAADALIGVNGPGIFLRNGGTEHWPIEGLHIILNSRLATYLTRAISQSIVFQVEHVSRLPLPATMPASLQDLQRSLLVLKAHLVAHEITERSFFDEREGCRRARNITELYRAVSDENEAVAAVLHSLEGIAEREVFTAYGLTNDDIEAVLTETGFPAGFASVLHGYAVAPPLPEALAAARDLLATNRLQPSCSAGDEIADLKGRLRLLYEAGPGAEDSEGDSEPDDAQNEDAEDESDVANGAGVAIPTETFLEELAQKVDLHPLSVYWLLRELREVDGVVCRPELVRFVKDYASVLIVRLLGHRWPGQVEGGDALPDWADRDGVIPITEGTGEETLLIRVRDRLAADFGATRASAVEREFEEIIGKPLGTWLSSDFFKRHISQFRKRPIAWQLKTSAPERRRGRSAAWNTPAFSCLVYYHRLDGDLVPKLRSQYIGPVRTRLQTELAGVEKLKERTRDQDARRVELEAKIEELRVFDGRLEEVIIGGFDSDTLGTTLAKEPLDKWTSRDGRAAPPRSPEALLAQERGYEPDLNDGVRVNIAPLQSAGLLAADVLATKDLRKAIADRAEWRADERRWCREGKLSQPGWWGADKTTSKEASAC